MKRRAFIGDVHGCLAELKELVRKVRAEGVDEIWVPGDLVDKGPNSIGVVLYCVREGIRVLRGNHEEAFLGLYDSWKKTGRLTKNEDKRRTLSQMSKDAVEFIRKTEYLAVFDDAKLVAVHGGLIPKLSLHDQLRYPGAICRLQMVHPGIPGKTRWYGRSQDGVLETDLRAQGWERWYRLHDWEYDVVYGHTATDEPEVHQNEGAGRTIGIDTGCVYGGKLTAVIFPDMRFLSVPAKMKYADKKRGD